MRRSNSGLEIGGSAAGLNATREATRTTRRDRSVRSTGAARRQSCTRRTDLSPVRPRVRIPEAVARRRDRRVRQVGFERSSLSRFFRLQRRLPNEVERRFVLPFEIAHLLDVRVVVRERLVHVEKREVELACNVNG